MVRNSIIPYRPYLKRLARFLRKHSTLSEVLLWQQIKGKQLGWEFHRQVPIDHFIVDFYCHELQLALEIGGSSHQGRERVDAKRQQQLERLGVRFLRFDDREPKRDMKLVIDTILDWIERNQP
ncbi:Very-short-patch-repair endonuclease [Catalinimonas alkaloidigena]|uniref:Very-short-patch-repair endonuclease n=1 Tax=Catalinimonas alkaloidigena TaxID=1075417 RepID=A0A1G9EBM0_9BACT|nr:DUF559 domain-containing protein [Catalinimonas alkaloidigena]SDK73572.1 Very-short-patch-repair endonuclease [Catalinimonas alkaloidigena]